MVAVVEGGDQVGHHVGGIGHRPAEQPRMQVGGGGAYVDVEGDQAPHSHAH